MVRLLFILILATIGLSVLLHFLKNYLLKEKSPFRLDWDGLLERLCIVYIMLAAPDLWFFIPLVVALKVFYRFSLLAFKPGIAASREPGSEEQKVLLKSELAFDLLASPAFAILTGVIF